MNQKYNYNIVPWPYDVVLGGEGDHGHHPTIVGAIVYHVGRLSQPEMF
jgi:hypothetical protein